MTINALINNNNYYFHIGDFRLSYYNINIIFAQIVSLVNIVYINIHSGINYLFIVLIL